MQSAYFYKKRKRKTVKGYFTVEASLLFPVIFVIQLLIICLSFYIYDRCVMEQCAFEAAFRGSSHMLHSNEEAYEEAKEAADTLIENRVLACDKIDSIVKASATEVCVSYEGTVNIPFMTWVSKIEVERKVPRNNQVRAIRVQEFGKELLQNGNQ